MLFFISLISNSVRFISAFSNKDFLTIQLLMKFSTNSIESDSLILRGTTSAKSLFLSSDSPTLATIESSLTSLMSQAINNIRKNKNLNLS